MPRAQFSLKTLLWLMVCAACFFVGRESQRRTIQRLQKHVGIVEKRETVTEQIYSRQAGLLVERVKNLQQQLEAVESSENGVAK